MKASYYKAAIRAAAASLALVLVFAMGACSRGEFVADKKPVSPDTVVTAPPADNTKNEGNGKSDKAEERGRKLTLGASDLGQGFYVFIAGADSEYSVKPSRSGGDWSIYVFDEKPEDESRIPENYEPALTGEGAVKVLKEQYVYVFLKSRATMDAKLEITGSGLPRK